MRKIIESLIYGGLFTFLSYIVAADGDVSTDMNQAVREAVTLYSLRCQPETGLKKREYEACLESSGANDPYGSFDVRKSALEHCARKSCGELPVPNLEPKPRLAVT